MDASTQHQEDLADAKIIMHVLYGVTVDELTPLQRVVLLNRFVGEFMRGWRNQPPGFGPIRIFEEGLKPIVRGTKDPHPRVLRLAYLGEKRLFAEGRPERQWCQSSLLLTMEKEFLLEVMTTSDKSRIQNPVIRIKPCTPKRMVRIMAKPGVFGSAVGSLKAALVIRRSEAESTIRNADELLDLFDRIR